MASMAAQNGVSSSRPDLLQDFSFEICARDLSRLELIRSLIPTGTVVSITYLPNETDEARVEAAAVVRRLGLSPMPHIAARRVPSQATLHRFLEALAQRAQVDRLFVIAGDLVVPAGPYKDALALIEELKDGEHNLHTVGISGYPEGHPAIRDPLLAQAFTDKVRALGEHGLAIEVMTQFAFDADPMIAWIERVRRQGFAGKLRLGLPGPANVGTLLKFAARCGVGASAKVMSKYGASITRLLNTAGPDRLYAELAGGLDASAHGAITVHLYPFGGLQKMAEWAAANVGSAAR